MLRSRLSSFFSTSYQLLPSSSSPPESTHNDSSSSLPLIYSSSAAASRNRTKRIVLGALAVGTMVALLAGWSAGSSELGETTLSVGGGGAGEEGSSAGLGWLETGASGEEGSTSTAGEGTSSDDISEGGEEEEKEEDKDELATSPPSLSNLTSFSDHPRIQLASPLPLPSPNPLPYPSPSSACLLHLFTLPSLSSFDPLLCRPSSSPDLLDVVTTFVNGTGPLFLNAYDTALTSVDIKPARRHYSNLGEMRFSLRSAARGLVGDRASRGTIRGVGADFPLESGEVNERLGQIPHWLDWSLVSRPWDPSSLPSPSIPSPKPISWAFHSEIFLGSPEWKAGALPTFNSFAIESQLHNVPSLSPNFVSMNDDFFIVRPMTASDFHSTFLGPVFKVQDDLKVTGKENARVGDEGEWAALDWAAWTLGRRHPSVNRGLEYLTHLPKTLTVPHLHEISITFKDALLASSSRKFREQKTSGPDLEIAFLATHYIRQRHREALLFSYVVARSGGTWGSRERAELVALRVDGWKGRVGDGLVGRSGLEGSGVVDFLEKAGEEEMKATEISFSSFAGVHKIPFPSPRPKPLTLEQCLGSWWTSEDPEEEVDAVWMFRRIAFENDYCGDLLLTAILNLTPDPGLTSLLPRLNSFFQPPLVDDAPTQQPPIYDVPHLPLTLTWEEADFTLETLFPSWTGLPTKGVDLLDWTLRLLGRYRHEMGSTPSHFTSLRSLASVNQLSNLMEGRPELALLAVNDDIPAYIKEEQRSGIGEQLRQWGEDRWPEKEVWESSD